MADLDVDAKGAHTENRRSAGPERIELITRGERRRSWTIEQKREIAVESLAPGTVSAATARRHGIGTGLLYTWRKQLLNGELGEVMRKRKPSPTFHGFEVTGDNIGPVQNVGRGENGRGVIRGA